MSWNGSCLYYFRRPRVGSGTREAEKSLVLGCIRGKFCLALLQYIAWGFGTRVGVSGQSPDPRRRKPESPLQRPLISLNITLTSTDRKLKLNSQGRVFGAQRPQKQGGGGGWRVRGGPQASTYSFAAAISAANRGRQNPLPVLYPFPKTPTGRHSCPGPFQPPHALVPAVTPSAAGFESPCSPANLIHSPPSSPKVTRVQGRPQLGRAKLPNSSPGPRSASRLPTQS